MADGIMKKLNEDVVIYILLRLAVKSLLRFNCISKTCYSLIKSSTFVYLYLNRTTTSKDEFILFKHCFEYERNMHKTILSFLSGDDDDDDYFNPIIQDLDVTHLKTNNNYSIDQFIGPCNGLIAMMDTVTTILINPSTRNYRLLPPDQFIGCQEDHYRSIQNVGFGYDSIANDYKVIRISKIYMTDREDYPEEMDRIVDIYDLSVDCWRKLDGDVVQQLSTFYCASSSQMFYSGICHWFASQYIKGEIDEYLILCFEMSTEIFHSLKIPEPCYLMYGPSCKLMLLQDSLALIYHPYSEPVIPDEKDLINIWIMKDYNVYESWTKKYTIRGHQIDFPLAIWKGYLFLYQSGSGSMMSYNLNSNVVKELSFHGVPKSFRVIGYKDSLTSIPRENEHTTHVQKF
uniref:S-locus F-box protein type-13 n=1 Tax=Solanum chilense TaxID=4083 RepID=A0A075TNM2_SOLCI|nr:S-locus F-box protein type-13 [Solanum chilense]